MRAIESGSLELFMDDIKPLLGKVAIEGGAAALDQLEITDQDMFSLVNRQAVDYALDRSAELVGKRIDSDGNVVDNPRAQYAIDDATREFLRADVAQAIEEGWSNDRLATAIGDNYAFSDDRAETVARTETAFADVAGNLDAWRASGLVDRKQWITAPGCCDDCQDLDGVTVDLDDDFPSDGGDGPPLHPNCRCDVVPVLTDSEG
jgi:SPP1 gp7 family putative phage head morphogenesis protein